MLNHTAIEWGNLCVSVSSMRQWTVKARTTVSAHLAVFKKLVFSLFCQLVVKLVELVYQQPFWHLIQRYGRHLTPCHNVNGLSEGVMEIFCWQNNVSIVKKPWVISCSPSASFISLNSSLRRRQLKGSEAWHCASLPTRDEYRNVFDTLETACRYRNIWSLCISY